MSAASGDRPGTREQMERSIASPPIDIASMKGQFGWTVIDTVRIPHIYRHEKKYVPVRVVEQKFISQYLKIYPQFLRARPPLISHYITPAECMLLTEVNYVLCGREYGDQPFTKADLIVKLADFEKYYDAIKEYHQQMKHMLNMPRGGWIQINNTVMPYILRHGVQFVPLSVIKYAAKLLTETPIQGEQLTELEWDYLNCSCKVAGVEFKFSKKSRLLPLSTVVALCGSAVQISELPAENPFLYAEYKVNFHTPQPHRQPKENSPDPHLSREPVFFQQYNRDAKVQDFIHSLRNKIKLHQEEIQRQSKPHATGKEAYGSSNGLPFSCPIDLGYLQNDRRASSISPTTQSRTYNQREIEQFQNAPHRSSEMPAQVVCQPVDNGIPTRQPNVPVLDYKATRGNPVDGDEPLDLTAVKPDAECGQIHDKSKFCSSYDQDDSRAHIDGEELSESSQRDYSSSSERRDSGKGTYFSQEQEQVNCRFPARDVQTSGIPNREAVERVNGPSAQERNCGDVSATENQTDLINGRDIKRVKFSGKVISVLSSSGEHLALLEVVVKLFFPSWEFENFQYTLEEILGVKVATLSPEEEKALIDYYDLQTQSLECNKAVNLVDLKPRMNPLDFIYQAKLQKADVSNSKDKQTDKLNNIQNGLSDSENHDDGVNNNAIKTSVSMNSVSGEENQPVLETNGKRKRSGCDIIRKGNAKRLNRSLENTLARLKELKNQP